MVFKARDLVRMISGGPLMLVDKVDRAAVTGKETIWCTWREQGDRQIRRETFSPVVLVQVKKPDIGPSRMDGRLTRAPSDRV
jgi:uncharacterized protein YodC (DUF2158 family)